MFNYQPPQHPWLTILYRDDDLLVCVKPAGLLSVPGKNPAHQDSLELRVKRVFPTVRVVHRLDMATSGLMLMAMHKSAQVALQRQFAERQVQKTYLAEVAGQLDQRAGAIDLPLRCDWPNRPRQMVCHAQGKWALTYFQRVAQRPQSTLVELRPVTGRSHQLRVHMQQLGHPLLGDRLYASPEQRAGCDRLHLHADQLTVRHPTSGELISWQAPPPAGSFQWL